MKYRFAAIAALTLGALAQDVTAQDTGIKLGANAPAAIVETLDGRRVDLSQFYGEKPVVLEFWATWCPLCRKLEPSLQSARERYAGKVTFVSVGVPDNQSPEKQRAYVEERKLTGEYVFDRESAAIKAFGVPHTSYIVVIKNGKVTYTGVGADQDIEAALRKAGP